MHEEWKAVPGFEGKYSASSLGRIKSHARLNKRNAPVRERIMKEYRPNGTGCAKANLEDHNQWRIDELVLMAFVGLGRNQHPCHRDGDLLNNSVDNLYWGTHEEAKRLLVKKRRGTGNKLTPEAVMEIRKLFFEGLTYSEISKQVGVSHVTVSSIAKGLTWSDL